MQSNMSEDQWKQLSDFHFRSEEEFPLPQKAQLYLTGISALGVEFMRDTNATSFSISAELPHKATGKKYKATYSIQEIKNAE